VAALGLAEVESLCERANRLSGMPLKCVPVELYDFVTNEPFRFKLGVGARNETKLAGMAASFRPADG
jgi:hypothetical protein